jgi:hypothetical protein
VGLYISTKQGTIKDKGERDRAIEIAFNSLREMQANNQISGEKFKIKTAMPEDNLQHMWVVRLDSPSDIYLFTVDLDANEVKEITHQT